MDFLMLLPLVFLSIIVTAEASAGILYAAAPETRGAFHVGGRGTYNYGYNTGDGIAKVEVRHKDGTVTGSYRYYDPLGRQIVRSYIADKRGFRVMGNDLPSQPSSPALGFLDAQTLTGTVEGTNEFDTLSISNPPTDDLVFTNNQNIIYDTVQATQSRNSQQEITNTIDDSLDHKILQHQQQLAELISKKKKVVKEYNDQLEKQKQLVQSQQHQQVQQDTTWEQGFTSRNQALGSNYFYSNDNMRYDFPAGFAYQLYTTPVLKPIGVKGYVEDNSVTAGHTVSARHSNNPVGYTRFRPRSYRPLSARRSTNYRRNERPYVIGHYK